MMMTRNEMIEKLKKHLCTVTFTKLNGDERVMLCTLRESVLPESTSTNARPVNDNVISVWSLEGIKDDGWRSFRVDSVKSFEAHE